MPFTAKTPSQGEVSQRSRWVSEYVRRGCEEEAGVLDSIRLGCASVKALHPRSSYQVAGDESAGRYFGQCERNGSFRVAYDPLLPPSPL